MKYTTNGPDGKKETEISCLKAIIIIVGVIAIVALIWKGLSSSLAWFGELPWYIYFPVGAAAAYVVFKIGQSNNWWN